MTSVSIWFDSPVVPDPSGVDGGFSEDARTCALRTWVQVKQTLFRIILLPILLKCQ